MKNTLTKVMYLAILAAWAFCPVFAAAAETELLRFSLEGHDGVTYTERSWPDRALVLFLSSREGAVHNEKWVWSAPVAALFSEPRLVDTAVLVRIADLSVVPRMFRGATRGMVLDAITPTADNPVRLGLMDWEGMFADRYELADDAYNILVFNQQGQLAYRAALRDFDPQRLDTLLDELKTISAQLQQVNAP